MQIPFPRPAIPKPFGSMTVAGDSLASDFGATLIDWGVTHKLAEQLNAAPLRVLAVNGALACRAQVGGSGDGGYAWVYSQLPRQDQIGAVTLLTNAPGSGTTSLTVTAGTGVNYAIGDVITIGGTNPEQRTLTNVVTDTLTVAALTNAHSIGDPVYRHSTWLPQDQLFLAVYGVNDILNLGPNSNAGTNPTLGPFVHGMRCIIARARAAVVFEDTHPLYAYGANWTANTGNPNVFSGGTSHSTTVSGSNFTFTVPGNCPATTLALFFSSAANGDGANWTISASGGQFTTFTFDTRSQNGFNYGSTRGASGVATGCCVRVAVPAANGTPYKITVTATTVTGTAHFDSIGVEAPTPATVLVTGENRPAVTITGTNYPARTATTLSGGTSAGATSFATAASGTTGWVIGDTVKIGSGATSDTLTVLTIPTAASFTTTAGAANAHSNGDAIQAGFQDADVTGIDPGGGSVNLQGAALTPLIRSLVAEFGGTIGGVLFFDKDPVLAKNIAFFKGDGIHYNNQGHAELATTLFDFLNAQVTITSRDLASASVPNRRTWIPVGANAPAVMDFQNGWANLGTAGLYPLQFYKDVQTGLVILVGAIQNLTSYANDNLIICTFPVSYRPLGRVVISAETNNGPATFIVDSSGNLMGIANVSQLYNNLCGVWLSEV